MQAVRHLFAWDRTGVVCVNAENLVGHTAWDMLQDQGNSQIRVMLRRAGALPSRSLLTNTSSYADFYILPQKSCYADCLRRPKVEFLERFRTIYARQMKKLSNEKRIAYLVVAVLLVTVTYQAVLKPPKGVWQDDYKPETNTTAAAYKAGTAIGLTTTTTPFELFLSFNTLTFFVAKAVTFLLLPPGGYISRSFSVILVYLMICYMESLLVITNGSDWIIIKVTVLTIIYML